VTAVSLLAVPPALFAVGVESLFLIVEARRGFDRGGLDGFYACGFIAAVAGAWYWIASTTWRGYVDSDAGGLYLRLATTSILSAVVLVPAVLFAAV
jgi:hypothetical protein